MDHLPAHAEQAAVIVEGDLQIPILVALLHGGEKMLAPVLDPFDRPPQQQARRRQRHLFRIHHELGAEAAADVGCHHAQLIFVEPQQHHQKGAHLVRKLRRRPQGEPVLVDVVGRERAAALDRVRAAAMLLETDAGAMGGAGERVGDVAVSLPELDQHVAGAGAMRARRPRCKRLPTVGYGRQWFVVDRDQGGRVLGEVARGRDHDRHRLADEGNLVLGKNERSNIGRQLRRAKLQRKPFLCEQWRKIREREHGVHAGASARSARVDGADRGMGVRTAHECRLQHVGKTQIGDETPAAGEQGTVFKPLDGVADVLRFLHALPPRSRNRAETPWPGLTRQSISLQRRRSTRTRAYLGSNI